MIIYSPSQKKITDYVDDKSYRYRSIMGQNNITISVSRAEMLKIPVGSYCDFQGERYTLERPKNIKKNHTRNLEYTLVFEGEQAKLSRYKMRDKVSQRLKFSLTAKPHEHLEMIVYNLNRLDDKTGGEWSVSNESIEATEKVISYNHNNCMEALQMVADAFDTEWEIKGKTLYLRKVEYNKNTPLELSYRYGFRPGIERRISDNDRAIDILYVQGGERNIDYSKYESKDLLLPKNETLQYDGQYFEDEPGFNSENAREYKSDNLGYSIYPVGKDSLKEEDSLDCTHIYPNRVGKVTGTDEFDEESEVYTFYDETLAGDPIDFDQYRIGGEKMTIRFETGMLASREFDIVQDEDKIWGYNKETHQFQIIRQEYDGVKMPNSTFRPIPGEDKYSIFGISLPEEYICSTIGKKGASWDMFREAVRYLYENEMNKFSFTGELDPIWAEKNWTFINNKIKLGGYVKMMDYQLQDMDEDLSEDQDEEAVLIRIIGIKDFINIPHSPQLELSNATIRGSVSDSLRKLENHEVIIEDKKRETIDFTKRGFRDVKETLTMLEEAKLHFSESINPITIHSMLALFGDEGLQFRFVKSKDNPVVDDNYQITYNQEQKILKVPQTVIQHMTMGISEISSADYNGHKYKFWSMPEYEQEKEFELLDPVKGYYLYALVERVGGEGRFHLSTKPYSIEDTSHPDHYCLLVGILNSEYQNERSYVDLYGFTEILPGRITTDKIVSSDGDNFMDFVQNSVRIGNKTNYIEFNNKQDGVLRLRGTMVQSQSGVDTFMGAYRGEYIDGTGDKTTYYPNDEVIYNSKGYSTYRHIGKGATTGIRPVGSDGSSVTWQVVASKGSDGNYYEYRYKKSGSPNSSGGTLNKDTDAPSGWSTAAPTLGVTEYLWAIIAQKTSDGKLVTGTQWSDPFLISGVKGEDGPAMVYRGAYNSSSSVVYYGHPKRVDVVQYGNTYYIARNDVEKWEEGKDPVGFNKVPTNTDYWNKFGTQFDSVATDLLLAKNANIASFIFNNERMESHGSTSGIPNIILDGRNNYASFGAGAAVFDRATSRIGDFEIVGGDLIGYNSAREKQIVITNKNVPPLDKLVDGDMYTFVGEDEAIKWPNVTEAKSGNGQGGQGLDFDYDCNYLATKEGDPFGYEFIMWDIYDTEKSGPGKVTYEATMDVKQAGYFTFDFTSSVSAKVPGESGSRTPVNRCSVTITQTKIRGVYEANSSESGKSVRCLLDPGKVTFAIVLNYDSGNPLDGKSNVSVTTILNIKKITFEKLFTSTILGNNGIISCWGADKYFSFSKSKGFEVRYGKAGLQVTDNSINKYDDEEEYWKPF